VAWIAGRAINVVRLAEPAIYRCRFDYRQSSYSPATVRYSSYSVAPGLWAKKAAGSSSSASAETFLPTQSANTQQKVTETKSLAKFLIRNAQLKQIAVRQDEGDAIPFEDVLEQKADEVVKPCRQRCPAQPLRDGLHPCWRLREQRWGVKIALLMPVRLYPLGVW
jgi:hypothetical protein